MQTHPQLAKKLNLLYGALINPDITSHVQLARCLGVTKQGVSKWINGTETSPGNRIPVTQLQKVADFFYLEPIIFTFSYEDFEPVVLDVIERLAVDKVSKSEKLSLSLLPVTDLDIVGRQEELGVLNSAWERVKFNMVQVVAFGGMGKSSLVNKWLSSVSDGNFQGAKSVYAWSFSWQGFESEEHSPGDFFIEHALEWFGDDSPDDGTPFSKATRLANLIRASKTLLILDGLEPLLTAPKSNSGEIQNPAVAALIKELAADNNGLCVITTRLRIADIASFEDSRVKTIELKNFDIAESRTLLKKMGVYGTKKEFDYAALQYAGHPLSLSLLGGYLNVVHDGEVGGFRELPSLFESEKSNSHANNIVSAYIGLFEDTPQHSILNLLGLIDRAVYLSELRPICAMRELANLTAELESYTLAQWKYALHSLQKSKLITLEKIGDDHSIDCHPLVRDFLINKLKSHESQVWTNGNRLLFKFLLGIASEQPESLTDLEPLFRAVIHGSRASMYREAFDIYFHRIRSSQFSIYTLGSHHSDRECLRSFFNKEWTEPVEELQPEEKFYVLSCAATNLIYLGDINSAIEPAYSSIEWFYSQKMWDEALSVGGPTLSMLITIGKLDEAQLLIEKLSESVDKTKNKLLQSGAYAFQGFVYFLKNEVEKAEELFDYSEKYLAQIQPLSEVNFPIVSSFFVRFLLETGQIKRAWERFLMTFEWREKGAWQVKFDTTSLYASDLLFHGFIASKLGDDETAASCLDQQVELLRNANEWLHLPAGLNYRAKFYIENGLLTDAARDLQESLSISERTGARFEQWESFLNYAYLHLKREKPNMVTRYLNKAAKLEGMNMYKFRDREIVELESKLSDLKLRKKRYGR